MDVARVRFPVTAEDCVFCRIASGRAIASVVREDATTLAFMDIRPMNPGHVLVIPKAHATLLQELPPGSSAPVLEAAREISAALRRSDVRCDAVSLYLADGREAGQEVSHVHLHVIPRFRGDGFGLRVGPTYGAMPPREDLDAQAHRIRTALGSSTV